MAHSSAHAQRVECASARAVRGHAFLPALFTQKQIAGGRSAKLSRNFVCAALGVAGGASHVALAHAQTLVDKALLAFEIRFSALRKGSQAFCEICALRAGNFTLAQTWFIKLTCGNFIQRLFGGLQSQWGESQHIVLQRYVSHFGVAAAKRAFLTARVFDQARLQALGLFESWHDPHEWSHALQSLQAAGVIVHRAPNNPAC